MTATRQKLAFVSLSFEFCFLDEVLKQEKISFTIRWGIENHRDFEDNTKPGPAFTFFHMAWKWRWYWCPFEVPKWRTTLQAVGYRLASQPSQFNFMPTTNIIPPPQMKRKKKLLGKEIKECLQYELNWSLNHVMNYDWVLLLYSMCL